MVETVEMVEMSIGLPGEDEAIWFQTRVTAVAAGVATSGQAAVVESERPRRPELARTKSRARCGHRWTYRWGVHVEFFKPSEKRRLCAWEATRQKRIVVPGSVMAAGASIPHDLAQYVIEAATGFRNGFWGLVSRGATFKSTGRKRTKPGRAVIAEHREDLAASEVLAGEHLERWRLGEATPVTQSLREAKAQWDELELGDRLAFEWPNATGTIVRSSAQD